MRRAERLFDIIQILRMAKRPVTAAQLADELEITTRTVYRDIADLQARRVPIAGEPGIGYVLQRGYDLPPLMFTPEEVHAVALGIRLLRRTRDARLMAAADRVLGKLTAVVPPTLKHDLEEPAFVVSEGDAPAVERVDLGQVREAMREARKIRIAYVDLAGGRSERTVWPIAMAYYVDVTLIGAWCELRQDFRNFRVDRIAAAELLAERFPADRGRLMAEWLALRRERP